MRSVALNRSENNPDTSSCPISARRCLAFPARSRTFTIWLSLLLSLPVEPLMSSDQAMDSKSRSFGRIVAHHVLVATLRQARIPSRSAIPKARTIVSRSWQVGLPVGQCEAACHWQKNTCLRLSCRPAGHGSVMLGEGFLRNNRVAAHAARNAASGQLPGTSKWVGLLGHCGDLSP